MSQRDKQEAAERAARAAQQAKHAAKNIGGAAEAGAEHVKDEIVDGAGNAYGAVKNVAKSETALRVTIAAMLIGAGVYNIRNGVKGLKEARELRENIAKNLAKADHHIRPDVA